MKTPQETALGFAQTTIEGQRGDELITPDMIAAVIDQIMMLPAALLATKEVDREALRVELETRYSVWIGKATALEQNENHLAWLTPERKKTWRSGRDTASSWKRAGHQWRSRGLMTLRTK